MDQIKRILHGDSSNYYPESPDRSLQNTFYILSIILLSLYLLPIALLLIYGIVAFFWTLLGGGQGRNLDTPTALKFFNPFTATSKAYEDIARLAANVTSATEAQY